MPLLVGFDAKSKYCGQPHGPRRGPQALVVQPRIEEPPEQRHESTSQSLCQPQCSLQRLNKPEGVWKAQPSKPLRLKVGLQRDAESL